jgi:hypothetical protein
MGLGVSAAKVDRDRPLRPFLAARGQALFGRRERALQRADDQVCRALGALLDLLPLEHAVLFQQAPAEPQQDRQRHNGGREDQRYETARRAQPCHSKHTPSKAQSTPAVCRESAGIVLFL